MINSLHDIKVIRKSLSLSQKDLATRAGVSQSLIAKMEAGLIDPSFSKAKRIIDALESARKKTTVVAKSVMKSPVSSVRPTDSTKHIVKIMRDKGFSQLPVIEREYILGIITESDLINALSSNKLYATDIMRDAPPVVTAETALDPIIDLLKHFPCVLVADKGQVKGIITRSDVIGRFG